MSKVEITIRYAVVKKNQDTFGKMENYVLVKINDSEKPDYKTKVIDGGDKDKPIEWNETFSVNLRPGDRSRIEFIVMDEDMTSDDLCGRGFFKPDACGVFNYGATQNYNIRLRNEKDKEENAGSLHISTRYV
jgi:Ca2+-dependent lipid-binding protein